jgi:hypothetical protein
MTGRYPSGGPLKRHVSATLNEHPRHHLNSDHPASIEGRTRFPKSVVPASESPRILICGENSRKIGKKVIKGRWSGMPIKTVTLEERATCPRSCLEWNTCYGNNMHWARRHEDDGTLMERMHEEIAKFAFQHPSGFVVRLHILGDFYSYEYVTFWDLMLEYYPALRIFGFTANPRSSDIGKYIESMNQDDRCWIRFSGDDGALGSIVINEASDSKHIVCPAQTGKTDCCGTCGLCWTTPKIIEFIRH